MLLTLNLFGFFIIYLTTAWVSRSELAFTPRYISEHEYLLAPVSPQ